MSRRPWPSLADLSLVGALCALLVALAPLAERATAQAAVGGPVTLSEPDTVHSDGADLKWSPFDTSGAAVFESYEIHRSEAGGFTPSASTLLTTIRDPQVTAYRDTSAAPSKSFSYRVVANGAASNEQTVALTSEGQAKKTLQPGPADGQATFLTEGGPGSECLNHGKASTLDVGADGATKRPLLSFDVRDIPAKANVSDARLTLKAETAPLASITVGAHKVTKEWKEGSGTAACTGDGSSWKETQGGVSWDGAGGNFASGAVDSVARAPSDALGSDSLNVTSVVQQWADGTAPNLGLLLKASDETQAPGKALAYAADDHPNPAARPKLTVSYADGSKAQGPKVSIATPDPAIKASGTREIKAATADDRRVEKVEFLIDGATVATDATAADGFTYAWNTANSSNAAHTVALKATDDAGNTTTSATSSYTVQNSAAPTARLTAPSTTYAQVVKDDQPAGYWRLGETSGTTAADASGAGRNGTYAGTNAFNQTSQLTGETPANPAVKFQNATTDGRVTISSLSNLLGSQLSAEAWVDAPVGVSTKGAYNRVLSRNWGSSGGWMLALQQDTSRVQRAVFSINQGGTISTATTTVSTGKHHLAGTYDGSALRLYVDGAQAASASRAGASFSNTTNVLIGETLNDDMTVDEPAAYNTALSAEQVKSHWEVGKGRPFWVEGANDIKADATDDGSVDRVEFYADGLKIGEDTSAPYATSWNTLDPVLPAYDGAHEITAKSVDDQGKSSTTTAPAAVTVGNTNASKYQADLTSTTVPTAFPQAVTYDQAAPTQEKSGLQVPVTNKSSQTWSAGDVVLRYRWISTDASPVTINGGETPLGSDLAAGASRTVTMQVEPPALPDGVDTAQYRLQVDLYSKSSSAWFADKGSKPLESAVKVNRALRTALGLEQYNHYEAEEIGAGMQQLVNVANGNSLLRWTPFESPGRGLATVLDITYNSLEKKSGSPIGENFSLSVSGLTRFGEPLDIHPNKADEIAGRSKRFVEFTDGDGTTHRFTGRQAADGSISWDEPAGVHLYLRSLPDTDTRGKWALTRPDRTTFFFDAEGYPTSVEDKNANRITYTLEDVPGPERVGSEKKRITAITDAAGQGLAAPRPRQFLVDYWTKAEAKKAHVAGRIQSIADHTGSKIGFDYYDDGNLRLLSQTGGRKADGTRLSTRGFYFTYTTPDGSGPAIPAAADRLNPDPKTSSQSSVLYSVRDPRGKQNQKETTFSYLGPGNGQDRWKLASREDRTGARTSYTYDTAARQTTVTKPLSRISKYAYDTLGSVTRITNPKDEVTDVTWSPERQVTRVLEPGGGRTEYAYNDNGMLTEERKLLRRATDPGGEQVATTRLEYENPAVDSGDVSGRWKAGRSTPHISQLLKKTDARGTASAAAGDFEWTFGYDPKGNVTSERDPEGGTTTRAYHPDGTINGETNPNGYATFYGNYDANGLAGEVGRDVSAGAPRNVTRFGYDDDGLLRWVQDPNHTNETGGSEREYKTFFDYDDFHRLGRQSSPKSTKYERGQLVWSGADYDENDNVIREVAPHYGREDAGDGAVNRTEFDAMDRPERTYGPDTSVDPQGERTRTSYDAAGRVTAVTDARGMATATPSNDGETSYDYDSLDRVLKETRTDVDSAGAVQKTRRTHYCYDTAGDLRSTTAPAANAPSVTCGPAGAEGASHTTRTEYDAAHRQTAEIDPLGHKSATSFDLDGNAMGRTDQQGAQTSTEFNGRGQPTKVTQAFDAGRATTTKIDYDAAGNRKRVISPRGFDATGGNPGTDAPYSTRYQYDGLDRPTRIDLPTGGTDTTPTYIHRAYDGNGNLTQTTLPVTEGVLASAPAEAKTELDYFDPASGQTGGAGSGGGEEGEESGGHSGGSEGPASGGWIRTSKDAVGTRTHFDYTAEGWQALRTPERLSGGGLDLSQQMQWSYHADGQVKEKTDRGGQATTYAYDANNNLTRAVDASGVTAATQRPIEVATAYDGFDQPVRTKQRKEGQVNWQVSSTAYDLNGNESERTENAEEDAAGTTVKPGERSTFTYDGADRVSEQLDYGRSSGPEDDQRVTKSYLPTGWERETAIARRDGAGAFQPRQSTTSDYYASGDQKATVTRNGAGAVMESHALSYLDTSGAYANGNRTSDRFELGGPRLDARCKAGAACTTAYAYDAKDRVTGERSDRAGEIYESAYALDPAGNVVSERRPDGSTATSEYQGNQLSRRTVGTDSENYFYDSEGNLDCSTSRAGTQADCSPAEGGMASGNLREDYAYDYQNRMAGYRRYQPGASSATKSDSAQYDYDALDRPVEETEAHGSDPARTTSMSYRGLTDELSEEEHREGGSSGPVKGTKNYSYDADGERTGMTRSPTGGTSRNYTYGRNPQGSVSLLMNDAGRAQASYGYRAYGDSDPGLTQENDPDDPTGQTQTSTTAPLNPYRFSAKRFDSGSGTVDMGARRFSPSMGRFVQEDLYKDALADLDLATDPLTQNRYQLTGGNPINRIEIDGHRHRVSRTRRGCFGHANEPRLDFLRREGAAFTSTGSVYCNFTSYRPNRITIQVQLRWRFNNGRDRIAVSSLESCYNARECGHDGFFQFVNWPCVPPIGKFRFRALVTGFYTTKRGRQKRFQSDLSSPLTGGYVRRCDRRR
jgi:RHS repeat-associated protein